MEIIHIFLLIIGITITCVGMGILPAVRTCAKNPIQILICAAVYGMILLWALFQLVSVPFILKDKTLSQVIIVYLIGIISWILFSVCVLVFQRKRNKLYVVRNLQENTLLKNRTMEKSEKVYWLFFALLFILQLVFLVLFAYADGDDAYYIGTASVAESSNYMYRVNPYIGTATGMDVRHELAPFPIWIAFLSRISSCPVTIVSHIVLPLVFVLLTYLNYYLIGTKVIKEKKWRPLFLIFMELFVIFGNYSYFTAETFLLTRSRQGKASIGNFVIPFLFLILFSIGEKIQENKKIKIWDWLLLIAGVFAMCLCSTLGSFLACLFIGISGICMAVSYKKFKILFPLFICCLPALGYAGIYLFLK